MGKATIIKVDGTEQALDHRPTLEEAQGIVGGYIEFTYGRYHNKAVTMVVDEEGLWKHKSINPKATDIHNAAAHIVVMPIVGDIIVLEGWRTVGK